MAKRYDKTNFEFYKKFWHCPDAARFNIIMLVLKVYDIKSCGFRCPNVAFCAVGRDSPSREYGSLKCVTEWFGWLDRKADPKFVNREY